MGYESRLYIGHLHRELGNKTKKPIRTTSSYCEKIAIVNLSKMNFEFSKIFTKPIDFEIYGDDGDTLMTEDLYGDTLKYTDINTVCDYLKKELDETKDNPYRRSIMLYDILKSFKRNKKRWKAKYKDSKGKVIYIDDLVVVHYGY